ncbi:MAG: methyltransferase domain-containing protein [Archangium sp.]|nr:methyltransferase domain-containing protein [Archangium sp.]
MSPTAELVDRFRAAITARFGLSFDDTKLEFLSEVLERRASATGGSAERYVERLGGGVTHDELRQLTQELTVGETYFFRNIEQFNALAEVVLPDRSAARKSTRTLRLLSAGCASGEEAYSLEIWLREHLLEPGWTVAVQAIDLNATSLAKAAAGRYAKWALRETPAELQERWFRPSGRDFVIDQGVREAVRFDERNLLHDDPAIWPPERYDVVFCRNVLMYFSPEHAADIVARITRSLAPGGYLFLGHAENLRGLSHQFHLCHTHGTFYYQRKDGPPSSWVVEHAPHPGEPISMEGGTWVDTIQRAADRISALSAGASEGGPLGGALPGAVDLSAVLLLLQHERFTDALAQLDALSGAARDEPNALLLRGVLLTHSGQWEAAEAVCHELLALDELSAGAHYLLALCREGTRQLRSALEQDQVAAYLDPGFAMPRLHLGILARRTGDSVLARRELEQALILLAREDASRLLLFGGGFAREALMQLCRTELRAVGGHP